MSRAEEFQAIDQARTILDKIIRTPYPEDFMEEQYRDEFFTFNDAYAEEIRKARPHLDGVTLSGPLKAHRLSRAWVHYLRAEIIVGSWVSDVTIYTGDRDVIAAQEHLKSAWRLLSATYDIEPPDASTPADAPEVLLELLARTTFDASFAHPKCDMPDIYWDLRRSIEGKSATVSKRLTAEHDAARRMSRLIHVHDKLTKSLRLPSTLPGDDFIGQDEHGQMQYLTLER